MRIAVICDTSSGDKSAAVMAALADRGHEVFNAGMTQSGAPPELQYIHTGLLAALLLNTGKAELAVGGCSSGNGFFNAAMQYPGVFCGLLRTPLDAWLFAQINGGNCISLPLNLGYGWGSDVNLRLLFDQFFGVPFGGGYPPQRQEPQRRSRQLLREISVASHRPLSETVALLPEAVLLPVLRFPGVLALLDLDLDPESPPAALRVALQQRLDSATVL